MPGRVWARLDPQSQLLSIELGAIPENPGVESENQKIKRGIIGGGQLQCRGAFPLNERPPYFSASLSSLLPSTLFSSSSVMPSMGISSLCPGSGRQRTRMKGPGGAGVLLPLVLLQGSSEAGIE